MNYLYVLAASIILYIGLVTQREKFGFGTIFSSVVIVLLPFIFATLLTWMDDTGTGISFLGVISSREVITAIVQLFVAFLIFTGIDRSEESTTGWFGWFIGGGVILFGLVPFIIQHI